MHSPTCRSSDPRHMQIAILLGLLAYGILGLDFEIRASSSLLMIGTALVVEWLLTSPRGKAFDPRSPLISGLSLCLLLRTNEPGLLCLGAFIAIASKFAIRFRGKHVFNPTNLALVALLFGSEDVWVSSGQWGSHALVAAGLACSGALVLRRAERSDITLAFLVFWIVILFGRSAWLGEPATIPLHRLQNGALLIFAFFMLSDPKTIPDSRAGRVLFALLVAGVAGAIQFIFYRPNGLLISLALCAPLTPMLDALLPGGRFRWPGRTDSHGSPPGFVLHPIPAITRFPAWGAASRRLQ
jgi:Na+-transporting NADH:ubiquinone oxidoreductase subunit NqrB